MSKIRVTQVRSKIGRPESQKRTLTALGLGKISSSVEIEVNPAIAGMIRQVDHLVKVEEI
ncbi:50S ribosomal protein L30 [Runella sp. MFBS21]|uniref:50S ribosomal protein L30 n=1 Tax=Runella sp. MFBS21 TaxID=3034018 RepID=UPI0023F957A9|nr:50S ribosomal protein L30 [Runella sp. MFBS21]MDF7821971.1 50S ribosomal protein L30 [Runella sp. MFBS21]